MDLVSLVRQQESVGVMGYCQVPVSHIRHCASLPCLHSGVCHERWNRFVCDCSATGHQGPVCMLRTFRRLEFRLTILGHKFSVKSGFDSATYCIFTMTQKQPVNYA